MKLSKIQYIEHEGMANEWQLNEVEFSDINLIVGKNASGKSRILAIISNTAHAMSGKGSMYDNGNVHFSFIHEDHSYIYKVNQNESKVVSETLFIDSVKKLGRDHAGLGSLFSDEVGDHLKFQADADKYALSSKGDDIQNPYLSPLVEWCKNLRYLVFSSELGRSTVFVDSPNNNQPIDYSVHDPRVSTMISGILIYGLKTWPETFRKAVIKDMRSVNFNISDVGTVPSTRIKGSVPSPIYEVYVVEGAEGSQKILQFEISTGMFRALATIINLQYVIHLQKDKSAFLIDDIGEGLDFQRSKSLINLVIKHAVEQKLQIIMTTNDENIMNGVPLKYWSIIQRDSHKVKIFNYKNSSKIFDEFQFMGINNFDFFAEKIYEG